MVGVPGRSKACATCRRRKKGCDLQRPACGQCRRARLPCGGYDRERIFLVTTQAEGSLPAPPYSRHGLALSPRREPSPDIALPDALKQAAYEQKYLGLFWESYLPNGRAMTARTTEYTSGGWTSTAQELYGSCRALRLALLANCLSMAGKRDGERWMVEEGYRMYHGALRETGRALRVPAEAKSDALLSAVRLMIIFEIFSGENQADKIAQARGWSGHNEGVLTLFLQRTPETFVDGHGHQLFSDGRLALAVQAVKTRKTSALASKAWKTVPWTKKAKTAKDLLIDILVDIPAILEGLDRLRDAGDNHQSRETLQRSVAKQCGLCDDALIRWYDETAPRKRFEAIEAAEAGRDDGLSTEDMAVVYSMTVYYTICLLLYSTMRLVGVEPSLPERSDPLHFVKRITRTMKYFFHPSSGRLGMEAAAFPLGLVLQFMTSAGADGGRVADERRILADLFKTPRGQEIGAFLRSMLQPGRASRSPTDGAEAAGEDTSSDVVGAWPFLHEKLAKVIAPPIEQETPDV